MFFESLETRQLMSASLDPVTKVLTIQGSSRDDVISVAKVGDKLKVTENGRSKLFTASKVNRIRAFGNAGRDEITIDASVTTGAELHAGPGSTGFGFPGEVLRGGSGNDTLYADGSGTSVDLFGGGGNDTLYATKSESLADGGSGNDKIYLRATFVQAFGGSGNDRFNVEKFAGSNILGGSGQDIVDFSSQTIKLRLGNRSALAAHDFPIYSGEDVAGLDWYNGVLLADDLEVLMGGRNNDRMYGGAGDNQLWGNGGTDYLDAGAGRDALHGGDGDDYLISRDGTVDFLSGGSGIDTARDDVSDIKVGVERYIE